MVIIKRWRRNRREKKEIRVPLSQGDKKVLIVEGSGGAVGGGIFHNFRNVSSE